MGRLDLQTLEQQLDEANRRQVLARDFAELVCVATVSSYIDPYRIESCCWLMVSDEASRGRKRSDRDGVDYCNLYHHCWCS
jgi:hypothetical protein